MTLEMSLENKVLTTEEILRREHSKLGSARKVIQGAIPFEVDDSGDSVPPLNVAVSTSSATQSLDPNVAYRLISDVDLYLNFSRGAGTATTSDIYLPAKTPMVIQTVGFDTINMISDSSGFAQLALLR